MNQKPNNAPATRNSSSTQGAPAPKTGKVTIKQLIARVEEIQADTRRIKNAWHLSHQYLTGVHSSQQKQLLKLHQLHDKLFAKPGLGKPAKSISQQRLNQYAEQAYKCIRALMANSIDFGNELDHLSKQ